MFAGLLEKFLPVVYATTVSERVDSYAGVGTVDAEVVLIAVVACMEIQPLVRLLV